MHVIHRDIKPENILLQDSGHIALTDFGTVLFLSEVHQPAAASSSDGSAPRGRGYTFCGSSSYISPEVLDGGLASPASDLWALGCIVYQLLTGSVLFAEENECGWRRGATRSYLIFEKISAFAPESMEFPAFVPDSARVGDFPSLHRRT